MYNKKHLSHRPFLIVNTKFLPGPGAKTSVSGWQQTHGWNVVEEIAIVDRVTIKHHERATVIIDILEAHCIKNVFEGSTKQEATPYFLEKYKEQIKESIGIWLESQAQKLSKTKIADIETARKTVLGSMTAAVTQLIAPQDESETTVLLENNELPLAN